MYLKIFNELYLCRSISTFKTLNVLLLIWTSGYAFRVDLTKETIDNLILQYDDEEDFSSCLGIADICLGMKTKVPKSSMFYGKPPTIGGSTLPQDLRREQILPQSAITPASLTVVPSLCEQSPGRERRVLGWLIKDICPIQCPMVRVLLPTPWFKPTAKSCKYGIKPW